MVSSPSAASQEIRAENISAATNGRPIPIALDHTTVGDVTTLHAMSVADQLDKVFLTFWNLTDAVIEVSLIISPVDDTNATSVDDATVQLLVPSKRPFEIPPFYVRNIAANSYTIAAFVATANVNNILVQGRYSRFAQGALTP